MQKKDRKSYVLHCLQEQSTVTVCALSKAMRLSEVSVRKLLASMEAEGVLRRTWGGAECALGSLGEIPYAEERVRHLPEKMAIALAAYPLIHDGEAIYIDCGTTALQLARLLAAGDKRRVMICTTALPIAMAFREAEHAEVLLIGGSFHTRMLSCIGGLARETLRGLSFDKCFLSGHSLSPRRGLTSPNVEAAGIQRLVLSASRERVILADSSKYGEDSLSLIAPLEDIHTLITDWKAPKHMISHLQAKKVQVLVAKPAAP